MDSFYGGKQGISFIIKDRFNSIDDMNNHFQDLSYDKTWYGEYCIIDTPTKNNIENGMVFKRTASKKVSADSKDTQYAEYVGQIIGPAGGIPNIQLEDLNTLYTNFDTDAISVIGEQGDIYYQDINSQYTQTPTIPTGKTDYHDNLNIQTDLDNSETPLIYKSGKSYYENRVTPAFKYGFYTFQPKATSNSSNSIIPTATIGIGFEIPYVDFDIDSNITILDYDETATVTPTLHNAFYKTYHFNIPAGKPGRYISDLQKVTVTSGSEYYYLSQINNNVVSAAASPISNFTSKSIIVGSVYYYNNENSATFVQKETAVTPTPAQFYLWDVQEIENIDIVTDTTVTDTFGHMTVTYTNNQSTTYELPLLRELHIKHENENSPYILEGYWGTATGTASVTIGQVAPDRWGVWATDLTRTAKATYATNEFDQVVPTLGSAVGNLGVYSTTVSGITNVSFYLGVNSDSYQWKPLGEGAAFSSVNIDINNFVMKDSFNAVTFNEIPKPMDAMTIAAWSDSDAIWK